MNAETDNEDAIERPGFLLSWMRAVGFFRGFLIVSLIPFSTGAMIAWRGGAKIQPLWLGLALLSVWLTHAATNLLNDYYDHVSGTDDINEVRTPFSGGTRVIQDGWLPDKKIRNAAWFLFVLAAAGFGVLGYHLGPLPWIFGGVGIFSGLLYTQKPVWLCYRGVGELAIALNFGPFLVAFSASVHLGFVPTSAWIVGMALGLWSAAIITINEVPDYDADKSVGKNNLVVIFGPKTGVLIWAGLLWASVAVLFLGIVAGILPNKVILATPIVFAVLLITRGAAGIGVADDLDRIVKTCRWTIISLVGYWILLLAGFYLSPVMRLA